MDRRSTGRSSPRIVAIAVAVLVSLATLGVLTGLPAAPAGSRSGAIGSDAPAARPPSAPTLGEAGPAAGERGGPSVIPGSPAEVAYGNTTIVLPGYDSLAPYAWSCNTNVSESVAGGCFTAGRVVPGRAGNQVPLLSWTADGAFYVNLSLDLVFYSFARATVTDVAPWLPLYDDLMWYAGVTNTEYLTADGSYVYEFGCLQVDCVANPSATITTYAVNVTTGRTFEHNWSSEISTTAHANAWTTYYNAQVNMVGLRGNDSIETLTVTWGPLGPAVRNGTVFAYNLWTGAEWKLADLPYFEANNLYWIPGYQQFFDVAADDNSVDSVSQLLLSGNPSAPTATLEGPFVYSTGEYGIGAVGGLWVNLTSRTVAFFADWQGSGGKFFAVEARLNPRLTVADFPVVDGPVVPGAAAAVISGEHRPTLVSGGYAFSGQPPNESNEWLGRPGLSPPFVATNVSQALQAWNVDGDLFYNTSYSILTGSDQCNRVSSNGTDCAILGTAPGTLLGTVWWSWAVGGPKFPFSADAPLAEPTGPAPVTVAPLETATGYELTWTVPPSDLDPILNFTVRWGTAPGAEGNVTLLPGNASLLVLPTLPSGSRVYYEVDAWNLHWYSPAAGNFSEMPGSPPGIPTILGSLELDTEGPGAGTANLSIGEAEPPSVAAGPIRNDTLAWGTVNGTYPNQRSALRLGLPVGSGQLRWNVTGLAVGQTYYVVAYAWNEWGESPPSNVLVLAVSGPPSGSSGAVLGPIVLVAAVVIAVPVGFAIWEIRRRGKDEPPPWNR